MYTLNVIFQNVPALAPDNDGFPNPNPPPEPEAVQNNSAGPGLPDDDDDLDFWAERPAENLYSEEDSEVDDAPAPANGANQQPGKRARAHSPPIHSAFPKKTKTFAIGKPKKASQCGRSLSCLCMPTNESFPL